MERSRARTAVEDRTGQVNAVGVSRTVAAAR